MAVGDESYLKGDSNREGSVRVLELAGSGVADLPNFALQALKGGRWRDAEFRNSAGSLVEQVPVTKFGAVGDGETDDTDAIADALAAVPDNAHIIFPAGKSYVMGEVALPSMSNVRISAYGANILLSGTGATFKAAAATTLTNVTFEGFLAEGEDDRTLAQHFFLDHNSAHTNFTNLRFLNSVISKVSVGLRIFDAGSGLWFCGNEIKDMSADGTLSEGWGIAAQMADFFCTHNIFREVPRHAVYSSLTSDNCLIAHNIIHRHRKGSYTPGANVLPAIVVAYGKNKEVSNNTFIDCDDGGVLAVCSVSSAFEAEDMRVLNNLFKNQLGPSIIIGASADGGTAKRFLVEGNQIIPSSTFDSSSGGTRLYDIQIQPCSGIVRNNVIQDAAGVTHARSKQAIGVIDTAGAEDFDLDIANNDIKLVSSVNVFGIVVGGTSDGLLTSVVDKIRIASSNKVQMSGAAFMREVIYGNISALEATTPTNVDLFQGHFSGKVALSSNRTLLSAADPNGVWEVDIHERGVASTQYARAIIRGSATTPVIVGLAAAGDLSLSVSGTTIRITNARVSAVSCKGSIRRLTP